MRFKEHEKNYRLRFDNGISIELLRDGPVYGGLGQVKWGRRKLRCTEMPILPFVTTPNGYEVTRLEVEEVDKEDESVTLHLRPFAVPRGRMEWLCCDGEDRWNVGAWAQEPERDRGGMLQLTLSAVNRTLGGVNFSGFSYAYRFHSRRFYVYRIHDRATWELGGWATGNTFWMTGPFNTPAKTLQNKEDSFTTAWCVDGEEPTQLQQFLPLFTELQGFTFQFDSSSLLVTAFEQAFHCRSLFQKEEGRNYLVHWHQLCDDLQSCVEFPAMQVLVADVPADEPALANRYCDIREELQAQYRQQFGLSHSWATASGRLTGAGPDAKGVRHGLDELASAACTRVYMPGMLAAHAPEADTVSARREATKKVGEVTEHAHARAMEVGLSLSDCCAGWLLPEPEPVEDEEKAPVLPAGHGLIAAALRDGRLRKILLEHLRRLKKEFKIDALYAEDILDSLSDQFEWAGQPGRGRIARSSGEVHSLAIERAELIAALQDMGYQCLLAGAGALDTPGRKVAYEDLAGREHMYRDTVLRFPFEEITEAGDDPMEAYFRGCANRLCFMPTYDVTRKVRGRLEDWWSEEDFASLNRAYQAVREYMEHSCVLPEGRGVLWDGAEPETRVLWAYDEFEWAVGRRAEVFDVMDSKGIELDEEEPVFEPEPFRVYLIQHARAL
ncbi:MAG: hypothetical protein R6V05_04415 [Candidatus Brocadiia bacterium]